MNSIGCLFLSLFLCANSERLTNFHFDKYKSVDYHLPMNTRPHNYDITLIVDVDRDRSNFSGKVSIDLNVVESSNDITINSHGLVIKSATLFNSNDVQIELNSITYNDTTEFLTISARNTLIKNSYYKLIIEYVGQLQNNAMGFYKKSYIDSMGQMKQVHAKIKKYLDLF